MHGPTCIVWANLTPFSLEVLRRLRSLARQPFVGVIVELAGLVGAAEHNGMSWGVGTCHYWTV